MILTEKLGRVERDENDLLKVKGSIGNIYFFEHEYYGSFYDGEYHYEIDDEIFEKKVEIAKMEIADINSQKVFEKELNRQKGLLY